MQTIKIAIIEDISNSVRIIDSIKFDLEIRIIFRSYSFDTLLGLLEREVPDIILIDFDFGKRDEFEVIKAINREHPSIRLILCSKLFLAQNLWTLNKLGVKAFVGISQIHNLSWIIKLIQQGGIYFTDDVGIMIQEQMGFNNLVLTEFELSLLKEISKGRSSTEMGKTFAKSPRTIEKYRQDLYTKLGVKNKVELIHEVTKRLLE